MSTKENFVKALKELTGFEDSQNESEVGQEKSVERVKIEPIHMTIETPDIEVKNSEFSNTMSQSMSELEKEDFGTKTETGVTSIPSGMIIKGNIEATDRIEMMGRVEGNVATTGDVIVTGTIIGDIEANELLLQGSAVKGNIKAIGNIRVEQDSKVVGNVSAESLRLDGRIKGNLNINQTSELASGAIVLGDIETGYISTSKGTKIKGNIFTKQENDYGEDDFDIEV